MMIGNYCTECMGSGIDLDGNVCSCQLNVKDFYSTVSCLEVPEQYRGINFSKFLVPKDVHESYGEFLETLHNDIISMRLRHKNYLICSPVGHSKSIFAYSCIERLFRNNILTFPLFDVLEIKRILLDTDLCRKQFYDVENPENLIMAPYVFIKIPRVTTWEVYDTISVILDRRVRRGHSTIFLYGGTWESLLNGDRQNVLSNLMGDGTYNTLEVKNWWITGKTKSTEMITEDNIG